MLHRVFCGVALTCSNICIRCDCAMSASASVDECPWGVCCWHHTAYRKCTYRRPAFVDMQPSKRKTCCACSPAHHVRRVKDCSTSRSELMSAAQDMSDTHPRAQGSASPRMHYWLCLTNFRFKCLHRLKVVGRDQSCHIRCRNLPSILQSRLLSAAMQCSQAV